MWAALQHTEWVTILATSRWLYGLVSVAHYVALFSCIGAIVLLDLRILGVAERNQGLLEFAEQLQPLTWIGSGAALVSGFLLFATEAGDYAVVTPFHVKMVIVALERDWGVIDKHVDSIHDLFAEVIRDGIEAGEFAKQDPVIASRCFGAATIILCHPQMVAQCLAKTNRAMPDDLIDYAIKALKK